VAGAATGALLVSFGLQNATMRTIKAENVPGAGHPEPELGSLDKYDDRIKNIDTGKFLAGCSRCGVCIQKCPFNAIKSETIAVPQLTDDTRNRCPGYDKCGICAVVCPTDCLNEAFSNFKELSKKNKPKVDKPGWWEGPYEERERQPNI
jgi:ferredoxin